jgi:putative transposase
VIGAPRVFLCFREPDQALGKNWIARLTKEHKIKALLIYITPRLSTEKLAILDPNKLQREFTIAGPNTAWTTDNRLLQGGLYLAMLEELL